MSIVSEPQATEKPQPHLEELFRLIAEELGLKLGGDK
jgi:hypothetical protein